MENQDTREHRDQIDEEERIEDELIEEPKQTQMSLTASNLPETTNNFIKYRDIEVESSIRHRFDDENENNENDTDDENTNINQNEDTNDASWLDQYKNQNVDSNDDDEDEFDDDNDDDDDDDYCNNEDTNRHTRFKSSNPNQGMVIIPDSQNKNILDQSELLSSHTNEPLTSSTLTSSLNTTPQMINAYNYHELSDLVDGYISQNNGNTSNILIADTNNISRINFKNIDSKKTAKFESKSKYFDKLLKEYNDLHKKSPKQKLKNHLTEYKLLIKLADLFLTHENYYSIMLNPIADNFKLDDDNGTINNNINQININQPSSYHKRLKHTKKNSMDESGEPCNATTNEPDDYNYDSDYSVEDTDSETESDLLEKVENQINMTINPFLEDEFKKSDKKQFTKPKSIIKNNNTNNHMMNGNTDNQFYLCGLCCHCLVDPITLVCGCTYCRNCLKEFNSSINKTRFKNKSTGFMNKNFTKISQMSQTSSKRKHECKSNMLDGAPRYYECYNCSKQHDHNTCDHLKQNIMLTKLVDKFWILNVDIRRLRNDLRNYLCFCLETNPSEFDLNKFDILFKQAYKLDPSNHLIIADLFIINYFGDNFKECLKYAQMACDLRPNWPFAYFLKMVYYKKMGDLNGLKDNLITCLKLYPKNKHLRLKLYHILTKSNTFKLKNSNENIDNNFTEFKTPPPSSTENFFSQPNKLSASSSMSSLFSSSPGMSSSSSTTSLQSKKTESTSILTFDYNKYIVINSHLVKPSELECSLCYKIFYNPVTTPCGHSFCRACLDRSLDHQDKCPLCKHSLADYLAERRQFITTFLDKLIKLYYQNEYQERQKQYEEELIEVTNNDNEVPVFVCTLALPFAPCPLHIYEPRYRLMLRRAIESGSNEFGMCMYSERTPFHFTEYGCMLEIRNYQFTRDGRAIVATIGGKRFKAVKSSTKDGYHVAQIEWIKDIRVEDPREKEELQNLHNEVYRIAMTWFNLIPETQKNRIYDIYGINILPEPEPDIQSNDNGPVWHWFLLNILPLENDFQYKFLTKTSLSERLKQIKKILVVLMAPLQSRLKHILSSGGLSSHNSSMSTSETNLVNSSSAPGENSNINQENTITNENNINNNNDSTNNINHENNNPGDGSTGSSEASPNNDTLTSSSSSSTVETESLNNYTNSNSNNNNNNNSSNYPVNGS